MDAPAKSDSQIIDALGGTTAVATLCQVSNQAVSNWREHGIPKARRMYLMVLNPAAFQQPAHPDDGLPDAMRQSRAAE